MAYSNNISNNKQNRDIKYVNRDFDALRNSLIEYSKTYFPIPTMILVLILLGLCLLKWLLMLGMFYLFT